MGKPEISCTDNRAVHRHNPAEATSNERPVGHALFTTETLRQFVVGLSEMLVKGVGLRTWS